MIYGLVNDFILRSRIKQVCAHFEAPHKIAKDWAKFQDQAIPSDQAGLFFLELDAVEDIASLKSLIPPNIQIIGFCSHGEKELFSKASFCGIESFPKSAFVEKLPQFIGKFGNPSTLKMDRESDLGASKLTILVFGTILAALLYAGFHILPFYYYYYELENQFYAATGIADSESDQEIRFRLAQHIKELQIPADPSDLKIIREDGMIKIILEYEEVFYVTFQGKDYDLRTFKFRVYAERKL